MIFDNGKKNVEFVFTFQEEDVVPVCQKIRCQMISNIMLNEPRKAHFVVNGYVTKEQGKSVFFSLVSRKLVRLVTLNDMKAMSCGIHNAYLNIETNEKIIPLQNQSLGQPILIMRALHGLCSRGTRFRQDLVGTLNSLGFKSFKLDLDIWMRPVDKYEETESYEYSLCYIEDVIDDSGIPEELMNII